MNRFPIPPRWTRPAASRSLAGLAVVAALALVGCSPSAASWTYDPNLGQSAPPAGASAGASAGESTAPLASASAAASALAAGASPVGTAGAGTALTLTAKNVAFDKTSLSASAGTPFSIQFDNEDAGVPHNVAIYTDSSASQVLCRGTVVTGPQQTSYAVPALTAGTYYFRCDVHPNQMNGTFTVH
jgi:plastocyanin